MNDELLTAEVRAAFDASAEGFTPAQLDAADLWNRGRTHRRRDLLQLVATIAVVVALAAATALVGVREAVPVDVPEGGALPVEAFVPTSENMDDITSSDDLAVGRTSVAMILDKRTMLLVSAIDGKHHVVRLPGLNAEDQGAPSTGPRLSPDGWSLAWPTRERRGLDSAATAIAVADLRTGAVSQTSVGEGTTVPRPTQLAWSPDSSLVAWQGISHRPLDGDGQQRWLGIVDTADGSAALGTAAEVEGWDVPLTVTDDGRVVTIKESNLLTWQREGSTLVPSASRPLDDAPEDWDPVALSPDSTTLAGNVWWDEDGVRGGVAQVQVPQASDSDRSALPVERLEQNAELGGSSRSNPVGWTPRGSLLTWTVEGHSDGEGNDGRYEVRRTALADGTVARTKVLVKLYTLNPFGPGPSVAGDLGDRAPVDFDAPAWAPGQHRWVLPLLVILTAAAAVWLGLVVRRRRLPQLTNDSGMDSGQDSGTAAVSRPTSALRQRVVDAFGTTFGVVVCLALATALVVTARPLMPRSTVTAPGDGTLPARVYALPSTVKEVPLGDVRSPASIAEPDGWGNLVLVDARDGAHRLAQVFDMDKQDGSLWESQMSLSPDGTLLAVPFARASTDPDDVFVDKDGNTGRTMVSGFAVHDLVAGTQRQVSLVGPNDRPVRVDGFAWSPDGSRLAWQGKEPTWWVEGGGSWKGKGAEVGVTDPRDPDGTSVSISRAQYDGALAVDDAGTGRLLVGRRLYTFDGSGQQEKVSMRLVADHGLSWSGAAISPDGTTLLTGLGGGDAGPAAGLRTIDLDDPTSQVQVHPWTEPTEGESVTVLGVTPEGRLVVQRSVSDDHDEFTRYVVGTLESVTGTEFTALTEVDRMDVIVATGLADHGSTEFGEPRWPISDERWFALGSLLVLLLLAVFRLARASSRNRLMRRPSGR